MIRKEENDCGSTTLISFTKQHDDALKKVPNFWCKN